MTKGIETMNQALRRANTHTHIELNDKVRKTHKYPANSCSRLVFCTIVWEFFFSFNMHYQLHMANLREFVENALQNSIERWKKNNEKKSLVRLVICVCVCRSACFIHKSQNRACWAIWTNGQCAITTRQEKKRNNNKTKQKKFRHNIHKWNQWLRVRKAWRKKKQIRKC